MELQAAVHTLIGIGARFPAGSEEQASILIATAALNNVDQHFGLPDNETLQSVRKSIVAVAEAF